MMNKSVATIVMTVIGGVILYSAITDPNVSPIGTWFNILMGAGLAYLVIYLMMYQKLPF